MCMGQQGSCPRTIPRPCTTQRDYRFGRVRQIGRGPDHSERLRKLVPEVTISGLRQLVAFRRSEDLDLLINAYRLVGTPE